MKISTSNTHIKSINDQGEISGYASVFNVTDEYNDVIIKGAFAKSVEKFNTNQKPKLLWQHDINFPVGVIEDLYEDNYGLFVKSRLILDIPKAREVYSLLKNKAIEGFSIGYKINDSYFGGATQYLSDINLLEISIVTFPACKEALIENIKSNNDDSTCLELINTISDKIKKITKGIKHESGNQISNTQTQQ